MPKTPQYFMCIQPKLLQPTCKCDPLYKSYIESEMNTVKKKHLFYYYQFIRGKFIPK